MYKLRSTLKYKTLYSVGGDRNAACDGSPAAGSGLGRAQLSLVGGMGHDGSGPTATASSLLE